MALVGSFGVELGMGAGATVGMGGAGAGAGAGVAESAAGVASSALPEALAVERVRFAGVLVVRGGGAVATMVAEVGGVGCGAGVAAGVGVATALGGAAGGTEAAAGRLACGVAATAAEANCSLRAAVAAAALEAEAAVLGVAAAAAPAEASGGGTGLLRLAGAVAADVAVCAGVAALGGAVVAREAAGGRAAAVAAVLVAMVAGEMATSLRRSVMVAAEAGRESCCAWVARCCCSSAMISNGERPLPADARALVACAIACTCDWCVRAVEISRECVLVVVILDGGFFCVFWRRLAISTAENVTYGDGVPAPLDGAEVPPSDLTVTSGVALPLPGRCRVS